MSAIRDVQPQTNFLNWDMAVGLTAAAILAPTSPATYFTVAASALINALDRWGITKVDDSSGQLQENNLIERISTTLVLKGVTYAAVSVCASRFAFGAPNLLAFGVYNVAMIAICSTPKSFMQSMSSLPQARAIRDVFETVISHMIPRAFITSSFSLYQTALIGFSTACWNHYNFESIRLDKAPELAKIIIVAGATFIFSGLSSMLLAERMNMLWYITDETLVTEAMLVAVTAVAARIFKGIKTYSQEVPTTMLTTVKKIAQFALSAGVTVGAVVLYNKFSVERMLFTSLEHSFVPITLIQSIALFVQTFSFGYFASNYNQRTVSATNALLGLSVVLIPGIDPTFLPIFAFASLAMTFVCSEVLPEKSRHQRGETRMSVSNLVTFHEAEQERILAGRRRS